MECKKCHASEKDFIWNDATCSCENWKYLASITDVSAICVMKLLKEKQKQLQQILMKKMQSVKQKISLFYLPFY